MLAFKGIIERSNKAENIFTLPMEEEALHALLRCDGRFWTDEFSNDTAKPRLSV